ncbi:hypothetical protein GCM10023115_35710 [Pontixanthobacter gangjinensis]|uniref:Thiol:disulfide interchange protein DsbD N-terminal domain-containing protein n=1 Tax=Christiangramia aestuarii TaxID=1028746 RepID=A0A7K1LR23_9FLAO|nr:hypothetical protein [Christiangramia aestuarii]MUP43262.1 hypothetical protein [Christiangramia aestuarii]
MSFFKVSIIFLFCLVIPNQQDFVSFLPENSVTELKNQQFIVQLYFEVKPGFHIQAEDEVPENIIPTSINFEKSPHFEILKHSFQVQKYQVILLGDQKHKVIDGKFGIQVYLKAKKLQKVERLKGELHYQACDDRQCFYPRSLKFEMSL